MAAAGFTAGQPQTPGSLSAIEFCFIWLPIIIYAVCAFILVFYRHYEKMEDRVKEELTTLTAP